MSAAASFALRVDEIWTIPGRPFPILWGAMEIGDVSVGACVEVESSDGSLARGMVEAIEQHGGSATPEGRLVGIMVSGAAAESVRPGSILRSCP